MNEAKGGPDPRTRNAARYFVESRHVAWCVLVATLVLGAFAYVKMPKRKDPFIRARAAVALCAWPGAPPDKVEDLVTRRLEEKIAQSSDVEKIESSSRTGIAVVTLTLRDDLPVSDVPKVLDDIDLRLRSIRDLPPGASPVELQKDFGDTAALLLTVASPRLREVETALRARALREALHAERAGLSPADLRDRSALVLGFSASLDPEPLRRVTRLFVAWAEASGRVEDARSFEGPGFLAVDGRARGHWLELVESWLGDRQTTQFHPEVFAPVVVHDEAEVALALERSGGAAYSYRELDRATERIARHLRALPSVAKVTRAGALAERIYLDYSQERLASQGITPQTLRDALAARSHGAGAVLEGSGRSIAIDATGGELDSERDIGDTPLTSATTGSTVHVRDVVDVTRDYETPPLTTTTLTWRDAHGELQRTRAISVAVQMRAGAQIGAFATEVDRALAEVLATLPEDLVVSRTSDQARQVEDKISLFMTSLVEAIVVIVVVGLVGFWEWRSALVLALSIPLTLAATFALLWALGIDLQQMSIAALILALGLLVDDPVVAGDAIQHELDQGKPRRTAAWLGPTKLARAILFATVTNIVAYLPFLLMSGDVGRFIYSLPVVLTCSLVASRLVSMTFIPLLGYTFLRARKGPAPAPERGVLGLYRRLVGWAVRRRFVVLAASTSLLVVGGLAGSRLRSSFFPKDRAHLFYVDVFLAEDASLRATTTAAAQADAIVREAADAYAAARHRPPGRPVLRALTTYVGGGAPRFWYSLAPQQRQPNYAQIVVEVNDDHDTADLVEPLQAALTSRLAGARVDVRQLENGKPVPRPVEVRFAGEDEATLRRLGREAKGVLSAVPTAARIRDDWGEGAFRVTVDVDPDRAAAAGVSSTDVATTSLGFVGIPLSTLREGDRQIPIVARLRAEERANAGDVQDLYVIPSRGKDKVPLAQIAHVGHAYAAERIQRRNQRRTLSVSCFPADGALPSEVMKAARPGLDALRERLPPGYAMEIGGAEENVLKVRQESAQVAFVSLAALLLALVVQFRHAVKPLVVLAAIPYGIAGALVAIALSGAPFGFTAILGVISLVGVIVSHVIVLFDAIEESRERGDTLETALRDAGALRLRPVFVTVGATVLGLVPLALHGGPLWEPLCYAQIGGLTLATVVTLVLVPVLYAIVVRDLGWVKWDAHADLSGDTVPVGTQAFRGLAKAPPPPPDDVTVLLRRPQAPPGE